MLTYNQFLLKFLAVYTFTKVFVNLLVGNFVVGFF